MAIYGHSNVHRTAKFVTLVLRMLETWFWCLSPGFGVWEILCDHFQKPQNDLRGQSGHLWPLKLPLHGQTCNFGFEHGRNEILVYIPGFWGMANSLGPFSDTSDWPAWPKWPLKGILNYTGWHDSWVQGNIAVVFAFWSCQWLWNWEDRVLVKIVKKCDSWEDEITKKRTVRKHNNVNHGRKRYTCEHCEK